ncbi:MAG: cobaltochelatase subunit CobN, partial [Pseudomonadota bacterium]
FQQSGDTAAIDAMMTACQRRGLSVAAYAVQSLRDAPAIDLLTDAFAACPPDVVINTTAFATSAVVDSAPPTAPARSTLFGADAVWLQAVLSSQSVEVWSQSSAGLAMRDIAMHVSLPEIDGRLLTRTIAFRRDQGRDPLTEWPLVATEPQPDRVDAVAHLAANWARLRHTAPADKRVAIVLANYPNRDARIGNGVGLDTPASVAGTLAALALEGFRVDAPPASGAELIAALTDGPTNARGGQRNREPGRDTHTAAHLCVNDYEAWFATLPAAARDEITARWGPPGDDPFIVGDAFALSVRHYGNIVVGIQPARGYNIDPKATYHDPALVPPHGYLAFYLWLRTHFGAQAILHYGKHGNLEWLPGKALALSDTCWPDIALGGVPNIYPFIVNDPGEGAQAKRRTSAVVVDHLMPPLTRAETYGPLSELETLVDEYYDAQAVDPRRAAALVTRILDAAHRSGLGIDAALAADDPDPVKLQKLDAYLCDLKEMQIRGGLHIFGRAPTKEARIDTLAALVRVPRGPDPHQASLHRAIADDLGLSVDGYDPLDCDAARSWTGARPAVLSDAVVGTWRTAGDTLERIEQVAHTFIATLPTLPDTATWPRTCAVLRSVRGAIAPALDASGMREQAAVRDALAGRFVAPGPAGAPTRGRTDVLPTGRNFYSLDSRALPTETAWELGRKAADAFVTRYMQDHGDWPRAIVLSAWGTSNMRTGGDDLAQALALMGARPVWDGPSRRVTGYEILPIAQLGRPRVDVTLRISGFFRDAFPAQIALIDSVVRAVADRDEADADNPVRAQVRGDRAALEATGTDRAAAQRKATFRIFGAMPGAYGAGLQAMFDEQLWDTKADLAEAFLEWGQFAYGADTQGATEREMVERRLGAVDAVLHNQDNREHDILDSDDYYQFAGGLAAAAGVIQARVMPVYHGDHARPETPKVRGLDEEIARVVRARAANPKWIGAMMQHDYKGAFELSATVDYLFAFAATTGAVRNHHFDALHDAYLDDPDVLAFLERANPEALADIRAKLREAITRGLWTPRRNSVHLSLDGTLSDAMDAGVAADPQPATP